MNTSILFSQTGITYFTVAQLRFIKIKLLSSKYTEENFENVT